MLQWVNTGTLGRTGWESTEVELPLFLSCEKATGMHGGLAWDGWGASLELMVSICRHTHVGNVLVGICYRLPDQGRSR